MELVVLSPEKELYKGQIKSVTVPGTVGQFQVLKDHAPIISSLTNGDVKIIKEDGSTLVFNIGEGFIEVLDNELAILVKEARIVD